jgi:hypothetical protein
MAATGDILPPRYRDPQRIARGGMGEIYHATDATLGRPVAIKLLADRYAEDESVRSRFTREALAAARLSGDPNSVTIFDVGDWNGRPFIVMEYMPGGSLEEAMRRDGAQEPGRALIWIEEAAAALDTAHAAGVVHRDVKPANLMLDREGNVHVGDFGIASAAGMDSLTKPGTILGTAGYLAPEQARGERSTPRTDQYALAVVAFELLTGARPYASDSPAAEASAHVNAPIPSISARRPDLPGELDPVFARALAKSPHDRYPSCTDFVAALRAALSAAAGQTRALAPIASVRRPATRHAAASRRLWPFLAVAALLMAVAGVALASVLNDDGGGGGEETRAGGATVVETLPGETVEVTVTAEPPPPPPPPPAEPPPPPPAESGAALNDQGFQLMQAGNYAAALPVLEQAVQALSGTGEVTEAYALYNLAATRAALGNCDGVDELLDRSKAIQGNRKEFNRVRRECRRGGRGNDDD